jgi:hypothetical protein
MALKTTLYLFLFTALPFAAISQKNTAAKISVSKFPCCDSLHIELAGTKRSDTLTSQQLSHAYALLVWVKNCKSNAKANIVSYEIATGSGKNLVVKGNGFNGKSFLTQTPPHYIVITKCNVVCTNDLGEPKTVVLPDRKFVIVP